MSSDSRSWRGPRREGILRRATYVSMYPLITVLVAVPLYHEAVDWVRGVGIAFALIAGVLLGIEKSQPAAVVPCEGAKVPEAIS